MFKALVPRAFYPAAATLLFLLPAQVQTAAPAGASAAESYLNANCLDRDQDDDPQVTGARFESGVYKRTDELKGVRTITMTFAMRDAEITDTGWIRCLAPACIKEEFVLGDFRQSNGRAWLNVLANDTPRCREALQTLKRAYPTPAPYGG